MKNLVNTMVGVALLVGTTAFGSGFKCSGDGYNVKLFNHTDATRTPAVLVISHEDAGTLLKRSNREITKHNRTNSVQYVVEGNRQLNADKAILQISFKEGRETLREGEVAPGQLILIADGVRNVTSLECERYLKTR